MADDEKIYRSTHKGAQIDEAVETVLNNDCQIKWGNITEGSIADQADLQGRLESKADKTTTINSYPLSSSIELTPADVHALPESTVVGRHIAMDDLKIVLKDKDNNTISEATISSYNKSALDTLFAGKSNINLDNLTSTGEAHFANPSLNNLDVVGQQLIDSKLNKANVVSKGSANNPVYFNSSGVAVPIDETYALKDLSNVPNIGDTINKNFITLAQSGTINLTTNSNNFINPNGNVTFVLPSVASSVKLNQILVQVKLSTVYSINVGTTHYFNGKAPSMGSTGWYDLIYEYEEGGNFWVCGWMKKS